MLPFRPIKLEDQELFSRYTAGLPYENSEMSFANLFIWRQGWMIQVCELDGVLYLCYSHPDTGCMGHMQPIVPLGKPVRPAVEMAIADIAARACGLDIMGVNQDFFERLSAEGTNGFEITEDRDLAEYIYLKSDLVDLPGKKYHAKRNHLNKFTAETTYEWLELTPELLPQCLSICSQWMEGREVDGDADRCEYYAVKEAVSNLRELNLAGALILVGGKPAAFTVGELLRPDMALIHLEKADPSVPGIYAFINQQFVHRKFSDVQFVNREEDMGIPGLRRAKESYYPHHMANKYRIRAACRP